MFTVFIKRRRSAIAFLHIFSQNGFLSKKVQLLSNSTQLLRIIFIISHLLECSYVLYIYGSIFAPILTFSNMKLTPRCRTEFNYYN